METQIQTENNSNNVEQNSGIINNNISYLLIKGQIIYDTLRNKHYRILYIPNKNQNNINDQESQSTDIGYWICIDSKSNIPKEFNIIDIQQGLQISRFTVTPDKFLPNPPAKISQAAQAKMEKAYGFIKKIVNIEPDIYNRSKRMSLLEKAVEDDNVTLKNLYTYLGKYWRGGMVKESLLPNFSKIGTGRKENFVPTKRLGRPSKHPGQNGKILTEIDFQNFKKYIDELYISTKKPKLSEVYENMLAHCYVNQRFDGDTSPEPLSPEEKPSYMQFYYWYKKHRNCVEEASGRLGEGKFNLKARGVTGSSETGIHGPGMAYQIDSTIADYYLVQSKDRNAIIGRPIIYFVRDVWSRMITGMYISLENPSLNCALMALKNCAEDKVTFCRRYGIEIKHEDWPCQHLPSIFIGDNGEMADYGIESIILQLGIAIQNTPPYRGDLKAVIESVFNSLNIHLHYLIPGHVDKDAGERGSVDRKKEACLDLNTFIRIVIRCVLFYNNKWYMEKYKKTPEMRLHQIKTIPLELWNYGMQFESGALHVLSQDEIYRILLPKSEATITENGIEFKGLYYTCADAESNNWFSKARISGRYKINIIYDPSCLDTIFIYSDNILTKCSLLSKSSAYSGASEEDMKRYHEDDLQEKASYSQEEEEAKSNLILKIEEEVSRCQKEKNNAVHDTVAAKLGKKHIRENRTAEKDEISGKSQAIQVNSVQISNKKMFDSTNNTIEILNDNIIDCLKQKGLYTEDNN